MNNFELKRKERYRAPHTLYREPDPEETSFSGNLSFFAAPLLFAAALLFLLLFFWQWQGYRKSDNAYHSLREQLVWTQSGSGLSQSAQGSRLDFAPLLEQNPDTVGWLSIPGLDLSLPVTRNADSTYYLRRGFDGAFSNNGCLFRPSWDAGGWADSLCHVIHGHNIYNGAMFGKLDQFRNEEFLAENPSFVLYTPEGDFRCTIFSVHDAVANDASYALEFEPGEEYDAFLEYLKALSLWDTGVEVPSGSRILTLSTCRSSYASNNQRFVVHAIMEPMQ